MDKKFLKIISICILMMALSLLNGVFWVMYYKMFFENILIAATLAFIMVILTSFALGIFWAECDKIVRRQYKDE
jgi:hypothetical protein